MRRLLVYVHYNKYNAYSEYVDYQLSTITPILIELFSSAIVN